MAITAEKVRKFAELYAHHGKGAEQYRVAFDCPDMTPVDSGRRAWDLLQREDVKAIVAEIRAAARERAVISHAQHLNDLKNIRDLAIVAGKYAAAAQAEIARGKSAGLYVEQVKVDATVRQVKDPSELTDAELAAIAAAPNGDPSTSSD